MTEQATEHPAASSGAQPRTDRMGARPPQGPHTGYPPGIKYIIGNEGCERFSFYGMRSILTVYMIGLYGQALLLDPDAAKALATQNYHLFTAGVYALPMVGAILADRLFGKYRTILYLSVVYCAGHAVLALAEGSVGGLHLGLALIAIGSGGIKPCVSANVGDQFTAANRHLVQKVFAAFYFIINFGSFFATLIIPWTYATFGASVAFGIPGVLMGIATIVFWMGRAKFVHVPPRPGGRLGAYDAASSVLLFMTVGSLFFTTGLPWWGRTAVSLGCLAAGLAVFVWRGRVQQDTGFLALLLYSARHRAQRRPGGDFFSAAEARFGEEAADGPRAVLRILSVFLLVSIFWALFDQHGSSWIVQATEMDRTFAVPGLGALSIQASQVAALNPLLVMLLIPVLGGAVFPLLTRLGVRVTPLRKMTVGMAIAASSFVVVALVQARMDELLAPVLGVVPAWMVAMAELPGLQVSVLWQIPPYLLITMAEVLVSVTGLEFAYTQAPRAMKSTIMGFWLLAVTLGNLLVALLAGLKDLPREDFFWVFAGLMAVAAALFAANAAFYKEREYLQRS